MHRVACANKAGIATDGVHIMGYHDGLVAVVGFPAKIGPGERCEMVYPYGRNLLVLGCHWWFFTTTTTTLLFRLRILRMLRIEIVPVKILAIKVCCLHDGADISIVRVRGLVARPLGAKSWRDSDVGRRGVQGWVAIEVGEEGEVSSGEGGEHGGEFGEEGGGGLGGWVAKHGAFVGVEACEDGDAEELAGAETGDG